MRSWASMAVIGSAGLVALTASAAPLPLVSHGEAWRWRKGTSAPQGNWRTVVDSGLDTNTWQTGNGGFGMGNDPGEATNCQTLVLDMNTYTTLYMRRQFVLTQAVDATQYLFLQADFDDGFIAWLDGTYLTSANVSGAPSQPAYTATANASHECSTGNASRQPVQLTDLGQVGHRLAAGTHTLAVMGLNQSSNSTDCIQVFDLFVDAEPPSVTNVWTAAMSPVLVGTNYTVRRNVTLIIEPGVTVTFGSGVSLTVTEGGRLLAEGTTNAPIEFTRAGASGSWDGLILNGGAGSPETRITHAQFAFNSSPCIQTTGATVFFDGLLFQNRATQSLDLNASSFVVRNCTFPSPTVALEPVHGANGIKAGGRGLFVKNFFGVALGYNDVIDFTGGQRPGPIVQFIDNVFAGSGDDGLDLDDTDAWVEGNIFLHMHKNGSPDTASGVSGGSGSSSTRSDVTVLGNLFFDCDQAALAKEGNYFVMPHNTVVHQTFAGGTDTNGAVIALGEDGVNDGDGAYLEANVIDDATALTRGISNAVVVFTNNLMQLPWAGPGGGNLTNDPALVFVPTVAETTNYASWADAQVLRDWLRVASNSPAVGSGPQGRSIGWPARVGAIVSGEPPPRTLATGATLFVGPWCVGGGIPTNATRFPGGAGYTHYRFRVDGGTWSGEIASAVPIVLTNLAFGAHTVELSGKRDTGDYQDDGMYGVDAVVTTSRTWVVTDDVDDDGMTDAWELLYGLDPLVNDAEADADADGMRNRDEFVAGCDPSNSNSLLRAQSIVNAGFHVRFEAVSNHSYVIEGRGSLTDGTWTNLTVVAPSSATYQAQWSDPAASVLTQRFYRVGTPAGL